MNLQDIFYSFAIILMLLWSAILIIVLLVIWKVQRKLNSLKKEVFKKPLELFAKNKSAFLQTAAVSIGTLLFEKLKSSFSKRKK